MNLIATLKVYTNMRHYVLTRGMGSKDWADAKTNSDFAVYFAYLGVNNGEDYSDNQVWSYGTKLDPHQSVDLFGKYFDLQPEHFRR
jgi:hypothetical protein